MQNTKKEFKTRVLVSNIMAFSFVILTITGLLLYVVPPGRVAKWVNWTFLGLTKDQWVAAHTLFSFLFIIFGSMHLYYNWKPLINSIRDRINGGLKRKNEFLTSVTIVFVLLVGTIAEVPPFQSVMDFGEYAKGLWSANKTEAPIPHAERMTVPELCNELKIDVSLCLLRLKRNRIVPKSEKETLEEIGKRVKKSPFVLYNIIKGNVKNPFQGSGLGIKKITSVCEKLKIDCNTAIRKLNESGIPADRNSTIKGLSEESGKTPRELLTIMGY